MNNKQKITPQTRFNALHNLSYVECDFILNNYFSGSIQSIDEFLALNHPTLGHK